MADAVGIFLVGCCRSWRYEPTGAGGAGRSAIGLAQQQAHDAVLAGAERQPPARGQIEDTRVSADLGQHGGEAATAQAFLEYPKSVGRFGDADDDQTARIETEAGEAGAIGEPGFARRRGLDDPQNRAIVPCTKAGKHGDGKAGHGGRIAALVAAHLVKRGAAEATGKQAVETGYGEGKDSVGPARGKGRLRIRSGLSLGHASGASLQLGDPAAQMGKAALCHENAGAHGF